VENVSPATATELQMDVMAKGVAIVSVSPTAIAANYGFQPGDIVRSINGAAITRVGELVRLLNATNRWDMVVERSGRKLTLSVEG
jgi:S1-C subfamily serine protease